MNKSLKTLKDVIIAVAAGKKSRAPYNESPLTHILKACVCFSNASCSTISGLCSLDCAGWVLAGYNTMLATLWKASMSSVS